MLDKLDEKYHQISLEEYFSQKVTPNLFAVSRVFAQARKQMNLAEYKAFTYALSNVNWKDACPDVLYMDKKTVAHLVGVDSNSTDLSSNLKRAIGKIPNHSFLEFADEDSGEWVNGCFITSIGFFKNRVRIRMNQDFLPLFGNLDKNYITMWSADIYKMHSERSIKFYELLRENSDTRLDVNTGAIGIKFFKELFDIPKEGEGSYMRTKENGGFNRSEFEQKVILPACEDLTHTEMIRLVVQPDGKYYEKVKQGGRVVGYRFFWTITQHPRVANAQEVKELQERVDKDPRVLKVAKDIVRGEKKPRKSQKSVKTNSFSDFEQRNYNYDELEAQLLKAQDKRK